MGDESVARGTERAAGYGRAGMVREGKRVEVRGQCGRGLRGRSGGRGVAGTAWIRRRVVEFHGSASGRQGVG